MGAVYKARHVHLDTMHAVKILHATDSETAALRFKQEAKTACQLSHTNLASASDFGFIGGVQPYLVMAFVEGETLCAYIGRRGKLPVSEVLDLGGQLCAGLSHAHKRGVIHRDLKPSNIMLVREHGSVTAKIVDFGIAKVLGESDVQNLTKTGDVFGSPLYMSPEQGQGKRLDQGSDIYSLGCLLFEMLTGQPPFRGENSLHTIFLHTHGPRPAVRKERSDVPARLESIVVRCLAIDPGKRFQSADEVANALGSVEKERSGGVPPWVKPVLGASVGLALVGLAAAVCYRPNAQSHAPKDASAAPAMVRASAAMRAANTAASSPELPIEPDFDTAPSDRPWGLIVDSWPLHVQDKAVEKAYHRAVVMELRGDKDALAAMKSVLASLIAQHEPSENLISPQLRLAQIYVGHGEWAAAREMFKNSLTILQERHNHEDSRWPGIYLGLGTCDANSTPPNGLRAADEFEHAANWILHHDIITQPMNSLSQELASDLVLSADRVFVVDPNTRDIQRADRLMTKARWIEKRIKFAEGPADAGNGAVPPQQAQDYMGYVGALCRAFYNAGARNEAVSAAAGYSEAYGRTQVDSQAGTSDLLYVARKLQAGGPPIEAAIVYRCARRYEQELPVRKMVVEQNERDKTDLSRQISGYADLGWCYYHLGQYARSLDVYISGLQAALELRSAYNLNYLLGPIWNDYGELGKLHEQTQIEALTHALEGKKDDEVDWAKLRIQLASIGGLESLRKPLTHRSR